MTHPTSAVERTHLDLFTGLAGFSLAAAANSVRTIAQVEKEEFLLDGLKRAWPDAQHYDDIKQFDGRPFLGVWLCTFGTPCQPASRAGEQRGASDDRWLWDQACRIVAESQPAWFIGENPPGILDVGLDGILAELEGLGYEVQPVSIPACAVDSPQDRERIWIIGHRNGELGNVPKLGLERPDAAGLVRRRLVAQPTQGEFVGHAATFQCGDGRTPRPEAQGRETNPPARPTESQPVADGASCPSVGRTEKPGRRPQRRTAPGRDAQIGVVAGAGERGHGPGTVASRGQDSGGPRDTLCRPASHGWSDYQWLLCPDVKGGSVVRRAPTGLHSLAARVQSGIPKRFRSKMIAALGNSIVWPVASEIIRAMILAEDRP